MHHPHNLKVVYYVWLLDYPEGLSWVEDNMGCLEGTCLIAIHVYARIARARRWLHQ